MQVELTDEQKMIQALARDFAEKEVRPIAEDIDREARFPRETVRRMGELGLMGIAVPEAQESRPLLFGRTRHNRNSEMAPRNV